MRGQLVAAIAAILTVTSILAQDIPANRGDQSTGVIVGQAPAVQPELRVLITGYLLGYYRIPDQQAADFSPDCPGTPQKGPTAQLLEELRRERLSAGPSVSVGMGDNFAVELSSRTYRDPATGQLYAKSRDPEHDPSWMANAKPGQIGDAVGCFLARAKYDAVVPGQNDFYFGPQRLRMIAQTLAATNNGEGHPVHLLAANMVVKTIYWSEPKKIPDSIKLLSFSTKWPEDIIESLDLKDHDTLLPFLRTLRFKVESGSNFRPAVCDAMPGSPDKIDLGRCQRLDALPPSPAEPKISSYGLPQYFHLASASNYGLCDLSGGKRPPCLRFSVAEPFFLAPVADGNRSYDLPYVYIPQKHVVIFGAVDPDIATFIGRDNLSWINAQDAGRLSTEVGILDPYVALSEAMQLFAAENPHAVPVKKILLAEMNRARAEELASHLGFDVVITKAVRYSVATPNHRALLQGDPNEELSERQNRFRAIVVSPWSSYEPRAECEGTLVDPLRIVELFASSDDPRELKSCRTDGSCRIYEVTGSHAAIQEAVKPRCLKSEYNDDANSYLSPTTRLSPPLKYPLVAATLEVIRKAANADVALLQKRDFYWGPFAPPATPGQGIERILWKGDGLRFLLVKGGTLKKVLDESEQFDNQDDRHVKESDIRRRGLETLGVTRTTNGDYLVDGMLLDEDRVYSVATSDHIAAGDTGYPELNDLTLNEPSLARSHHEHEGIRISYLVCEAFHIPGCVWTVDRNCVSRSSSRCAQNARLAFPSRPGIPIAYAPTQTERFTEWAKGWEGPRPDSPSALEKKLLVRPTWRLSLNEASVDLARPRNNLTEPQRVARLQGVSESDASGQSGHSVDFSARAEWVRNAKTVDEYIRGQLEYKTEVTDRTVTVPPGSSQVLAPANVSRSKNRMVFDAGFFIHFINPQKHYPKLGVVLQPFRFDSPLHPQEAAIDPHFDALGNVDRPAFVVELARTRRFLARTGFRVENPKSHFELGYEGGVETNALSGLTFNSGSCDLSATQLLKDCLDAQGAAIVPATIQQHRQTRSRSGFYVDAHWEVPLFKRWSYIFDDQGEWFAPAHGDNTTDTLYRNDLTVGLSVRLIPSISLAPGLELFSYENKIGRTHLSRVTPTLKLKFNFDHYSGGDWWRSIKYSPQKQ